jgi:hypothetical protein
MSSIRKRTWKTNGVKQTAWALDYRDQSGQAPAQDVPDAQGRRGVVG